MLSNSCPEVHVVILTIHSMFSCSFGSSITSSFPNSQSFLLSSPGLAEFHLNLSQSYLFNYWTCIVREWDEKKTLESLVDKCVSSSSVTGDIFHIEVFTSGLASFSFTVLPSFQLIQTNICKRNSNSLEEKYFSRVAAKPMERHRYFTLSIFFPKMLRRRFRYST